APPAGAHATHTARAAAPARAASYSASARLYTPGGLLLAEEFGANGQALEAALQAVRDESGRHFDPHLVQVFDRLAPEVYRTLTESSEEELQALLTRMVRKHFSL
ncbi:MAG: hypothetical protein ACK5RC_06110, partial [Curvibacter sp.]